MSAWTDFVTKFYHEKKEQNKDYKFKDALKDGAKEYKKENAKKEKANPLAKAVAAANNLRAKN